MKPNTLSELLDSLKTDESVVVLHDDSFATNRDGFKRSQTVVRYTRRLKTLQSAVRGEFEAEVIEKETLGHAGREFWPGDRALGIKAHKSTVAPTGDFEAALRMATWAVSRRNAPASYAILETLTEMSDYQRLPRLCVVITHENGKIVMPPLISRRTVVGSNQGTHVFATEAEARNFASSVQVGDTYPPE